MFLTVYNIIIIINISFKKYSFRVAIENSILIKHVA
jgi:hypothetical protein